MDIEQVRSIFPTTSEQRNAEKVLEFLIKNRNVDVLQISEGLSPNKSQSARYAECQGIECVLSNLLTLRAVACADRIYNPNETSQEALDLLYMMYKPKRKMPPVEKGQSKYITLFCFYCGDIISTRGTSKTTICPKCGQRNTTGVVLVRSNSMAEYQAAVKHEKYRRYGGN